MAKKSLSEILKNGVNRDQIARQWNETKPADDFGKPVPRGEYVARLTGGELFNAKTKATPGYKLCFEIIEGEYAGRKLWHDIWLSEAAIAMAKRDLGKLGVTSIEQLDRPLPQGIRCRLAIGLRKADDGTEWNSVRSFEVVGIDAPDLDPFAPTNNGAGGGPPSMPPTITAAPEPDEDDGKNENQIDKEKELTA